jgi:hypothetical protein
LIDLSVENNRLKGPSSWEKWGKKEGKDGKGIWLLVVWIFKKNHIIHLTNYSSKSLVSGTNLDRFNVRIRCDILPYVYLWVHPLIGQNLNFLISKPDIITIIEIILLIMMTNHS